MARSFLALIIILLSGSAAAFEAEQLFDLEYAALPTISPDGESVAYVRVGSDIQTDQLTRQVWVVNVDGTEHRPVTEALSASWALDWSADGSQLVVAGELADDADRHWALVDYRSDSISIHPLPLRAWEIAISPSGRYVAISGFAPVPRQRLVSPRTPPIGAKWARSPREITDTDYRYDGKGYKRSGAFQLFLYDLEQRKLVQATSGKDDVRGPFSWSANERFIYFSGLRDTDPLDAAVQADIYRLDRRSGELKQETRAEGEETQPKISPDGRWLAYLKTEKVLGEPYRVEKLVIRRRRGGKPRILADGLDRQIKDFHWAGDSSALYFSYADDGAYRVGKVRRDDTVERDLAYLSKGGTGRPYSRGEFSVSTKTGALAITTGSYKALSDVGVVQPDDADRRVANLTRLNDKKLKGVTMSAPQQLNLTSSVDGQTINGWYMLPHDYREGQRYPLLVEIHGGPHGSYGPHFSWEFQTYAAHGYIVYFPNYRGSRSYGKDFGNLLKDRYPGEETHADLMAGVDALIEKGLADSDRLFISGGSAGGVQTGYSIGLTDRFRAAVMINPSVNWTAKVLTGDLLAYQVEHQFPGAPWENLDAYWARSPLSLVGNVTTPTLLMTGERDWRTPISETEQYFAALKLRRVDTIMVRVPRGGHSFSAQRPSWQLAKMDYVLAWLARYGGTPID